MSLSYDENLVLIEQGEKAYSERRTGLVNISVHD